MEKQKSLALVLKKWVWNKALLVDEKSQDKFQKACKNLKNFKLLQVEGLNVYDVLKYDRVVLTPHLLEVVYRKCGVF